ncbi:MAG: hypothetical protein EAY81_05700 [Bacteroidetes bacterium]|nr:MAG: hypothetical protein EAY81_05700 [Bacteroidota bacterium]
MDTISCINNTTWEQYAKGELSKETLDQLNEHVLSCEICADMKEGIDSMEHPAMLLNRVNQINNAIDKKTTQKSVTINRWYVALAASLLFVTGLIWYINHKEEPQKIAMVQDMVNPKPLEKSTEPIILDKKETSKKRPIQQQKPKGEEVTEAKNDADDATENTVQLNIPPVSAAESDNRGDDAIEEDLVLSKATSVEQQRVQPMVIEQVSKPERKRLRGKQPSSLAQEPYVKTQKDEKTILDRNNQIDSVRYSNATTQFTKNAFDSCVAELLPISNEPSSQYYESGLLLLAKAYLGLNKRYMAEPYLQRVIQLNGKYKQEALELLKQ